jgi:hypothetical protein
MGGLNSGVVLSKDYLGICEVSYLFYYIFFLMYKLSLKIK